MARESKCNWGSKHFCVKPLFSLFIGKTVNWPINLYTYMCDDYIYMYIANLGVWLFPFSLSLSVQSPIAMDLGKSANVYADLSMRARLSLSFLFNPPAAHSIYIYNDEKIISYCVARFDCAHVLFTVQSIATLINTTFNLHITRGLVASLSPPLLLLSVR